MRWTQKELDDLHLCVAKYIKTDKERAAFETAAAKVGKSVSSCRARFFRTDWNGQSAGVDKNKPWKPEDLILLHQLKNNQRDSRVRSRNVYIEIGKTMGRSPIACERKYQNTNWPELLGDKSAETIAMAGVIETERSIIAAIEKGDKEKQHKIDKLVDWLSSIAKMDFERLEQIDEATFLEKVDKAHAHGQSRIHSSDMTIPFSEIKNLAKQRLDSFGLSYPKEVVLDPGTYVIVGDSHGKKTRTGMFKLLTTINETIKPKKIIHIGHIFDDSDEISVKWDDFDNLLVVGMSCELKCLKEQPRKYDVVRSWARIGQLSVGNQYDTTDFVKKPISRIDPALLPDMAVINCHRHEMHSHCMYHGHRIVASPGCLCEPHIIETVKTLIFKDGFPSIRSTHPGGYHKYNKQERDAHARWEQGLIIVTVNEKGECGLSHCRIRITANGFTTAYAGTIMHEQGTEPAERRIFFNGDMHTPFHDAATLDIQEQFCNDYKPDVHVNIGDLMDNRALNHHMGGSTGPAFYVKRNGDIDYGRFLTELAAARYIMKRMRKWAPESHLIVGNHERFAMDFVLKHPQFEKMMDLQFILGTVESDTNVIFLKKALDFGGIKFIHGDVKIWGGSGGSKIDKVASNYGGNTVMGNIHYPAIRNGCYSVGLSGMLDQGYNEADASQWIQGFGYCDVYGGQCFVSLATVMGGKCLVGGEEYAYRGNGAGWELPPFKPTLTFDFSDGEQAKSASPNRPQAATGLRKVLGRLKSHLKG